MSEGPEIPKRKFDPKDLPRSFMSPAYVEEVEPNVFQMFRDILVETDEVGPDGKKLREKLGKRIGPMMVLRPARDGEPTDFMTSRPDGTVLLLYRINPPHDPMSPRKP